MHAACTCFQTLYKAISINFEIEHGTTHWVFPAFRALSTAAWFPQVDKRGSKTSPILDAGEEQFGSLVKFVLEAFFSDF